MPTKNHQKVSTSRLVYLDYLRGYFVMVIIIDHLWRFPNLFQAFTGQAMLWVTAAEGFVIISGFLIGYIRGYKGRNQPFISIAIPLIKRAFLLYIWMVIASLTYVWLELSKAIPEMPFTPVGETNNWLQIVSSFIMIEKPHVWVHFLYLYTVFLLLSVPTIGLLRQKKILSVILGSLLLYLLGLISGIEWMKWQVIFFIPSTIGFYFEPLRSQWRRLTTPHRNKIVALVVGTTVITVALSALCTYITPLSESPIADQINGLFIIEDFFPPRVFMAFLWFSAWAILFHSITPWLHRHTRGIVEYVGTHSLTMYIAHGLIICVINYFFAVGESIVLNTFYGCLAIGGTYLFVRLPIIRRILPR